MKKWEEPQAKLRFKNYFGKGNLLAQFPALQKFSSLKLGKMSTT
jgi:hypothetical protein